jgi:hypothetical protein
MFKNLQKKNIFHKNDLNIFQTLHIPIKQTRLTKIILAILTRTTEGTIGQLATSSCIDSKVRCETRYGHCAMQRQKWLYATQLPQIPAK